MTNTTTTTDLSAFLALVAELRHAQREYFRTRSSAALEASKRLEKQVDAALARLADRQPKLFGDA